MWDFYLCESNQTVQTGITFIDTVEFIFLLTHLTSDGLKSPLNLMWSTQILIAFLWTWRKKKKRDRYTTETRCDYMYSFSNKGQDCNYLQHGKLIIGPWDEWWRESWWAECSRGVWRRVTKLGLILAIALPRPSWYMEMLASLCGPHGSTSNHLHLKWHASALYLRPGSTGF